MRSLAAAASLLAANLLLTTPAAAQNPDSSPPPPASAEAAETRAGRPDRVPGANRAPDARRRAEGEQDSETTRTGDPAVDRPARESRAGVAAPGSSGSTATPARAVNGAAAAGEDQRGERRGSVRRPPQDRGRVVDRAVPRTSLPPSRTTIVRSSPYYYYPRYSRYYDPWGYGSFGLGYFYYSPWAWGPAYGYGPYAPYGGPWGYDIGSVRIKVRPRDAEVWVDGYYAGTVDDFDGVFQALRLDSGPYRIEIRKPGFETLSFDVRVQPDRTITFRGDLRPLP